MTVKIKYDRKTGKVKKITGNIGQTRANLAAYQLWRGNVEPTRWYKLRRLMRCHTSDWRNTYESG